MFDLWFFNASSDVFAHFNSYSKSQIFKLWKRCWVLKITNNWSYLWQKRKRVNYTLFFNNLLNEPRIELTQAEIDILLPTSIKKETDAYFLFVLLRIRRELEEIRKGQGELDFEMDKSDYLLSFYNKRLWIIHRKVAFQ